MATYDFYGIKRIKVSKLPANKPVKILQVLRGEGCPYYLGLKGAIYVEHTTNSFHLIKDGWRLSNIYFRILDAAHKFKCITDDQHKEILERLELNQDIQIEKAYANDMEFAAAELGIKLTKAQQAKLDKINEK